MQHDAAQVIPMSFKTPKPWGKAACSSPCARHTIMVHLLRSGHFVLQAAKVLPGFSCSLWCLLMSLAMSTCQQASFSTHCKPKVSDLWWFAALHIPKPSTALPSSAGVSMSSGYPGPGIPEATSTGQWARHWVCFWDTLRLQKTTSSIMTQIPS